MNEHARFRHVPHPHIEARKTQGPVKTADQLPAGSAVARFNTWLALKVTASVGTMWCAYFFCILAFIGIPAALGPGGVGIVNWFTEEFIQLVLLSIIMVGQLIQGAASDKRAEMTYLDAEAMLHESAQIQAHLQAQDDHQAEQDAKLADVAGRLDRIVTHLEAPPAGGGPA